MEEYSVLIRNDMTGETTLAYVTSASPKDAQVEALTRLFHEKGWRRASAAEAQSMGAAVRSA